MRHICISAIGVAALLISACQSGQPRGTERDPDLISTQDAQAGCAMCIFKMEGVSDCLLGVRIAGQTYLVDGSGIDDHGDAHADDGLCQTARRASVEGGIENGRFVAGLFELLP